MNILMLSDVYFPRVNGVSTSIQTFRRELRALGHGVHLLAPDYFAPSDDESHITRIPARPLPRDPEDRMMSYRAMLEAAEQLRGERFDLIHIQTPFVAHYAGQALARRWGIPRVESYHTFFEEYLYHYIPFLPRALMRYAARRFSRHQCNAVDGLVAPSLPMLEVLRHYGIHTHAEIIPTGLETDCFQRGDGVVFRQAHGIGPERPVLLFVGRVAHEKNIGFLLRMTARLRQNIPDVLLIIAGEGPAASSLKSEARHLKLNDNILFVGYLDREHELKKCYRAADVFVFASRTETQGLVLLEAMAQGVPLVSTAELGTASVLQDGQGARVVSEDEDEFARAVGHLLTHPQERHTLGEAGYRYALTWSAAANAEKLVDFYQEILTRAVDRRPEANPRFALPG